MGGKNGSALPTLFQLLAIIYQPLSTIINQN